MKKSNAVGLGLLALLTATGCGSKSKSHDVPWGDDETVAVIDPDREVKTYTIPEAESCSGPDDFDCGAARAECEAGAEIVLSQTGKPIETICYPKGDTLTVAEVEERSGNIAQNENDAVIALDNVDDGVDIKGDLSVDANNVVVYGEDPATNVIEGDVNVDGNNIIVRGVTIQGDVLLEANNAVFLHCVIEGNVVVTGNNAVIAACDVFGKVELRGNNTKFVGNRVAGGVEDEGKNTVCEDNVKATDTNMNQVLESSELGAAISCDGGKN